ncbi:amidohydrolase family protein [Leifsonia sp. PS1209]|uniref:amidohydrolase family protein n=1 Tax=Leifsonia sp. PS1209 TaxID=2724914 RepID=UPI001FFB5665|nr:amidohydrolase family protein [Leifsonia sp. PS1209]
MSGRIDAHVHLWDRTTDPQDWIDPQTMQAIDRDFGADELTAMLASTGVRSAIVVQASNSLDESVRLARLASPVIAGLVAWVDLAGDIRGQLDRIRMGGATPVVGIRHLAHIDPDPEWLSREEVGRGMAALEAERLSFDLVVRDWQLGQAARLADRHDGMRFVLDHLGGPPAPGGDLGEWAAGLRELARRPNVTAKLSGLSSGLAAGSWTARDLAPVVDVALDAFGPSRLMYGSDWPLAELGGGAPAWIAAVETLLDGLSAAERDRVFGGTAREAYSLA